MKNQLDLRVVKTEENLRTALISLLHEKELKKITVKDICDKAKCSRNAFYFHYQYKEDLYDAIIDNISDIIVESLIPVVPTENMLDNMSIYTYSEKLINGFNSISDDLKSLLVNDNGELEKKITLSCYKNISSNILTFYNINDSQKIHLISNYLASSLVGFMLNFINNKETNKKLATQILSKLLEGANNSVHELLL